MNIVNTLKKLGVAVSLFAMSQGPAQAIVTTYTDLALWESAVASYTTETFDDLALQGQFTNTIAPGSFTTPLTSIQSFSSTGFPLGDAIIVGGGLNDFLDMNGAVDTVFNFNPGVYGIGADWNTLALGGNGSGIRVTTAAGTVDIGIVDLTGGAINGIGFWGFTIDSQIMSIELIEATPLIGQETFLLDNLRMAEALAQVPEPAILALMGIGLIGIGFSRRQRKG